MLIFQPNTTELGCAVRNWTLLSSREQKMEVNKINNTFNRLFLVVSYQHQMWSEISCHSCLCVIGWKRHDRTSFVASLSPSDCPLCTRVRYGPASVVAWPIRDAQIELENDSKRDGNSVGSIMISGWTHSQNSNKQPPRK